MYSLSQFREAFENPVKLSRELNRRVYNITHGEKYNKNGFHIFEEDWDNLIILDACRYDKYSELANIGGELEARTSRGGATYEFVPTNFSDVQLLDTVYLTTNSWYTTTRHELNSELYKLIDLQYGIEDEDKLDPHFDVVKPEVVTRKAKEAHDEYPHKRLIIHYLQPHHPFIGDFGRDKFRHKSSSIADVLKNTDDWSRNDVIKAYDENLELVLDEVESLLPSLNGKTVVTADHGEMLGEKHRFLPIRDYGHHAGIYYPSLVKVPWHITEYGNRKSIESGRRSQQDTYVDQEKIEEQLAKLGYK